MSKNNKIQRLFLFHNVHATLAKDEQPKFILYYGPSSTAQKTSCIDRISVSAAPKIHRVLNAQYRFNKLQ